MHVVFSFATFFDNHCLSHLVSLPHPTPLTVPLSTPQAQNSSAGPATQADRLTRQRLRDEFPGVDPRYLDDLLDMHDGDYRQVLRVLQGTRGERPLQTAAIRAPSPPPPATVSWQGE